MRGRDPGPINSFREKALIHALVQEQNALVSAFNAVIGGLVQDSDTINSAVESLNDAISPWRAAQKQKRTQIAQDAVAEVFDMFHRRQQKGR